MKNQYFGDFGDYQKVSLLQDLKKGGLNMIVHWLKTVDDQSTDGKHIAYLDRSDMWRSYEPEIYDYLKQKISVEARDLAHIERSLFCKGIDFANAFIEDSDKREKSIKSIVSHPHYDLVFFDPDNGIEVLSTTKKNVHKYVLWKEIIAVFNSGKSVMIYQHFSRSNREGFIQAKLESLKRELGGEVLALRVKHSVYLFVMHHKHTKNIKNTLEAYVMKWKGLATLVEL